jgi:3-oxoacyl-[acyl-carrier protein] reductase
MFKSIMPLGRFGDRNEIAGVAAFLAGPDASYITGTTITVDRGFLI